MLRDLLIALSLANFCFLPIWRELFNDALAYYAQASPTHQLAAVPLNVLLLALVFWTGAQLARRSKRPTLVRLAHWAFILVALVEVMLPYLVFLLYERLGWRDSRLWFVARWLLIVPAALFLASRWEARVTRALGVLLLIASPFVAVTFYRDIALAVQMNGMSFADPPPAPRLPAKPGAPRVVWVIFDELDQRLVYAQRPASVHLPQFDRLRAQALSAEHAFAPARFTEIAMPALISGRLISKVEPRGASELMVTYGDSATPVAWSRQPNVFSGAREMGFNTALVGWSLPYCRVLASSLSACSWYDGPLLRLGLQLRASIGEAMKEQAAKALIRTLGLKQANRAEREEAVRDYLAILTEGKHLAADPALGLTLVHLPVPHPVGIWDRRRHDLKVAGDSSYLDNLELADHSLGELRRAMEAAGVWESSTVVVSGDHWWRSEFWHRYSASGEEATVIPPTPDHRVPFVVKLAGQSAPLTYQPEMNTILTHDLLLAVLRDELHTPQEVAAWLDRNRSLGDSPYNVFSRDRRQAPVGGVSAEGRAPRDPIGLSHLDPLVFEAVCPAHFDVARSEQTEGTHRRLPLPRRRGCA